MLLFQNQKVEIRREHSHPANHAKNEIDKHIDNCKELIASSDTSVQSIYNETVATLKNQGLDLVAEIPSFQAVKSSLYRVKNARKKSK